MSISYSDALWFIALCIFTGLVCVAITEQHNSLEKRCDAKGGVLVCTERSACLCFSRGSVLK